MAPPSPPTITSQVLATDFVACHQRAQSGAEGIRGVRDGEPA